MSWKQDTRLLNILQDYTATCKCGHRVRLTNKYKRAICEFCGNMVYLDKAEQSKHDFKSKLRSILNENNKDNSSTIHGQI